LRRSLLAIIEKYKPMTVRQVFYQAVSRGLIDKTEREYKGRICRLLALMRKEGELPYDWIADNTRWMRKPDTFTGLAAMLEYSQQTYRRAIWEEHDCYVEIWLEKEALAGVLIDVTWEWDVPLMVTRGYPSISFIHSAAEAIKAKDKPTHLYYFGDLDPSGVDISRVVESGIRDLAPDVALEFSRVAVTREQVAYYGLPTRPTKKTDSRAKSFKGRSVEVDAIDPDQLRALTSNCIVQHVDARLLKRIQRVEKAERKTLQEIKRNLSA
jgi:hypothetical protein